MRKKISMISAFLLFATTLSGCSLKNQYSDENCDIVATYIAHAIIKYDKNMAYKLVEIEQEDEGNKLPDGSLNKDNNKDDEKNDDKHQSEDDSKDNKDDDNKGEKPSKKASLSDVLGVAGVEIKYKKYQMYNSYERDSLSIEPKKGNVLVFVTFNIKNIGKKDQHVILNPNGINYRLKVDGKEKSSLITSLSNDILYYDSVIKPGKSKEAVLVFEVEDKEYKSMEICITSDIGEYNYTITK